MTSVLDNLAQNMPKTSVLQNLADSFSKFGQNAWSGAQSAYQNSIGAAINNDVSFGLNGSANGGSGSNPGDYSVGNNTVSDAGTYNGSYYYQGADTSGSTSQPSWASGGASDMPGAPAASTLSGTSSDIPGSSSYGNYSNGTTPIDQAGGDSTPIEQSTPIHENTAPAASPVDAANDPGTNASPDQPAVPQEPTIAPMTPESASPAVNESDGLNMSPITQPTVPDASVASNESAGLNMNPVNVSAANDPAQLNTAPAPGSDAATNTWASSILQDQLTAGMAPSAGFAPIANPNAPPVSNYFSPGMSAQQAITAANQALADGVSPSAIVAAASPSVQAEVQKQMDANIFSGLGPSTQQRMAQMQNDFMTNPQQALATWSNAMNPNAPPLQPATAQPNNYTDRPDGTNAGSATYSDSPWGVTMNGTAGNGVPAESHPIAPSPADIATLAPLTEGAGGTGQYTNTAVPDSQSSSNPGQGPANVPLPQMNPNSPAADRAQDAAQDAGFNNDKAAAGVNDAVNAAAQLSGMDPNDLGAMTGIESNFGNAADTKGSQYMGPLQMGSSEFSKGMQAAIAAGYQPSDGANGDIHNVADNITAGAMLMQQQAQAFTKATGQSVSAADMYGMHQQVEFGWATLVNAAPGTTAMQAFRDAGISTTHIYNPATGVGNIPPSLKGIPPAQITAQQFVQATNQWFYSKGGSGGSSQQVASR